MIKELIKNFFRILIKYCLLCVHFSRKYRLRLIGMLTFIFVCFTLALIWIIKKGNMEPVLLCVDTNQWLGAIVGNAWTYKMIHKILGFLNLGPSSEKLVGIMLHISFTLILLIVFSYFKKFVLIPLTIMTTVVFMLTLNIVKRYFWDGASVLFNKWGVLLQINDDPFGFKDPEKIGSRVDQIFELYNHIYSVVVKKHTNYHVEVDKNYDRDAIIEEVIANSFESWDAIEFFICDKVRGCFHLVTIVDPGTAFVLQLLLLCGARLGELFIMNLKARFIDELPLDVKLCFAIFFVSSLGSLFVKSFSSYAKALDELVNLGFTAEQMDDLNAAAFKSIDELAAKCLEYTKDQRFSDERLETMKLFVDVHLSDWDPTHDMYPRGSSKKLMFLLIKLLFWYW